MAVEIACRRRSDCRLCGSRDLALAFALTPTPPANAFVKAADRGKIQEAYPLDLFFCKNCTHLQLLDVVDPSALFEDYVYVSGTSPVFVEHFRSYARDLIRDFGIKPGSLIVDIGSNDGTLLKFFKDAGMRVLGVDPAREIAAAASRAGIETWPDFFTPELAARIGEKHGTAAAVTANNVFAHADDLKGILRGVKKLLAPDGIFAFEVSYLADVVEKTLFDTIYHEHLAYHAVKPLRSFLEASGLRILETLAVDSHGGSLRVIAGHAEFSRIPGPSVLALLLREESLGLDRPETFAKFARRVDERKERLTTLLSEIKSSGKRIAGFGAPAKATTLMYHFGLGPEFLDFVVDDSPLKQGLLTPGRHIPVLPSSALYERRPDYALILAWNFADSIRAKHDKFHSAGGKFIVPLPDVKVY